MSMLFPLELLVSRPFAYRYRLNFPKGCTYAVTGSTHRNTPKFGSMYRCYM